MPARTSTKKPMKCASRTATTASACDAAAIHQTSLIGPRWFFPQNRYDGMAMIASTMIVYFETLCVTAARIASSAAIHSAVRTRWTRSQLREPSCSRACPVDMPANLPRWCRDERAPARLDLDRCGLRLGPVPEEAVDGRACAADVGAERAESIELGGERRRRELVRREDREVFGARRSRELFDETRATRCEAVRGIRLRV